MVKLEFEKTLRKLIAGEKITRSEAKQKLQEEFGLKIENVVEDLKEKVLVCLIDKKLDKATELITTEIKKKYFIYTTREDIKSEVWIYSEGVYIPKGRSYIREFTRNLLGKAYTDTRANHVISKIEVDTYIEPEDFFEEKNIDEVPVQNGILNIKTLELSEFTPSKIFFNKLPVEYNPEAECPAIDKFLSDILKREEDKKVAYEIIGHGLRREYTIEKALMCVGKGRNGKGKFLELIKRFVGAENCSAVPLAAMKYDSSAICELHKRLFNLGGDLGSYDLKETATFKGTIGRDLLQAKRKYLRDLMFKNYAKHIFAANELPKVYDMTDGFWTKWVLFEFPYKFVIEKEYKLLPENEKSKHKILDPFIIDKITTPEELSGLLNKALEGLKRIMKGKDFSYSLGTKQIKDAWIRMSDSFRSFCLDKLDASDGDYISKEDLRKEYYRYCRDHKVRGAGDKEIKATLQDLFGVSEKRVLIHDEREYVWHGVKFKIEVKKL